MASRQKRLSQDNIAFRHGQVLGTSRSPYGGRRASRFGDNESTSQRKYKPGISIRCLYSATQHSPSYGFYQRCAKCSSRRLVFPGMCSPPGTTSHNRGHHRARLQRCSGCLPLAWGKSIAREESLGIDLRGCKALLAQPGFLSFQHTRDRFFLSFISGNFR